MSLPVDTTGTGAGNTSSRTLFVAEPWTLETTAMTSVPVCAGGLLSVIDACEAPGTSVPATYHRYSNVPLPVAVTPNVASSPTFTFWLPVSDTTDGRWFTVTCATRLVTAPTRLVATNRYAPSCDSRINPRSSTGPLATANGTSLRNHRYCSGSVPSTTASSRNVATPSTPDMLPGCCTINGGCITLSTASSVSTDPSRSVSAARYTPSLDNAAREIVSVAEVAPAIGCPLNIHWTANGGLPR